MNGAKDALIERACEVIYDAYGAAAVTEGWETQERARRPWADIPEANKATMRAAVRALLDWLNKPCRACDGTGFVYADTASGTDLCDCRTSSGKPVADHAAGEGT